MAWLLYACAHARHGVELPLGLAIHRTLQGDAPGAAYDRLAQLPPAELQALIQRHRAYGFSAARVLQADWAVMEHTPYEHLEQLLTYLFPEAA